MTAFEDRERAAEKKFVLEAEEEFKAEARRDKKLAFWAAELMGKNEADAENYVQQLIAADMEEPGDEDVFRKLRDDLKAAGVEMTDLALREKMNQFMNEARREIHDGL